MVKAVIFGCSGKKLTLEEKRLFERSQPLGIILFERNLSSPTQIKALISSIKDAIGRDCRILIDQEGGRVQRLKGKHWRQYPAVIEFGKVDNWQAAKQQTFENFFLIGQDLKELGINVNCAPVVDVQKDYTHSIIGDRAFFNAPNQVSDLSLEAIKGLYAQNIIPVIKHLPGHGRATADSHLTLPIVSTDKETFIEDDALAFKQVVAAYPNVWGMTAHVLYSAWDRENPATFSSIVINELIRRSINFHGFLISDCLTMQALSGSYSQRTYQSFVAGCDAVLHCSGNIDEMIEVSSETPDLKGTSLKRYQKSLQQEFSLADLSMETTEWHLKRENLKH